MSLFQNYAIVYYQIHYEIISPSFFKIFQVVKASLRLMSFVFVFKKVMSLASRVVKG